MESIKDLLPKAMAEINQSVIDYAKTQKMDFSSILEIEYRRTIIYIESMLFKSEQALINAQNEDLPNEQKISRLNAVYDKMRIVYLKFNQLNEENSKLRIENEMLKKKFEYFKIKP